MKAICIKEPGAADVLTLTEADKPAIGDTDVLIQVKAAGINRPDVLQRLGMYPPPPGASPLPGLEVSGIVEAVGSGVKRFEVGDEVCALLAGGGYAEYAAAPEGQVLPKPQALSFEEAAALPETFFTVWSNVFDRAYATQSESLLVHGGTSGIGTTAIMLAKAFGLNVFTTQGSADKCAFAQKLGADLAINYHEQDFVDEVKKATGGKGVDIVLDMVGGSYIPRNISCLAVGGRHVSIAFLGGPTAEVNFAPVMMKRLVLTGSTLRARSTAFKTSIAEQLERLVWPIIDEGGIKPVIDSVFPLDKAAEAHKRMESSAHMGKIILTI